MVQQRGNAITALEQINATRIAQMMQHTAGGSVACHMLTPLPLQ
jgi:hypothetical protein